MNDADGARTRRKVAVEDAWSALTDAPLGLTEVGVTAFDGDVWTAGGLTADGHVSAAVQIFDPEANRWRRGPDLPEPIHHAALVTVDDRLVVLGGYSAATSAPVTDVFALDVAKGAWREAPSLPEPRGAGAAAWDGARLVYGGGAGSDGPAAHIWALDHLDAGDWVDVGRLSVARDHLAATTDGHGTVWFLGGREATLESNRSTVDRLVGDEVVATTDVRTPRGGVAAFFADEHGACLVGGEGPNGTFAEVECVAEDGTTSALPRLSTARHGLGAAVVDGVAFVALGGTQPGLSVSTTIEALDLAGSSG